MTDKEFCAHMLAKALVQADAEIHIQGAPAASYLQDMLRAESFTALREIRDILDDGSLSDRDCFDRIDQIVSVFEELGSGGGSRHDFG